MFSSAYQTYKCLATEKELLYKQEMCTRVVARSKDFGVFIVLLISYAILALRMLFSWDFRTVDYVTLMVQVSLVFWLGKHFRLPAYSVIMAMFISLPHAIGILGLYAQVPLYDTVLHVLGGLLLTPFLAELLFSLGRFRKGVMIFIILILLMVGVGALHEFNEYFGYLFFGLGNSVYQMGTGDFTAEIGVWQNTMIDMLANATGAFLALLFWFRYRRLKKGR
jgi:hypothetical protein